MRKEIRAQLEAEAEKYASEHPTMSFPKDMPWQEIYEHFYLSGAEAGFKLALKLAAEKCEQYVDHEGRNPGHFIAPTILALGGEE